MITKLLLSLFKLFSSLPYKTRGAIGSFGGALFSLFPSREKNFALLQLKLILPNIDPHKTCRKMFQHVGRTILEAANAQQILQSKKLSVVCNNQSIVDSVRKNPNKVVCLTGHLGCWDLLAAYIIKEGIPIASFATKPKGETALAIIEHLRDSYGITIFWRSDGKSTNKLSDCITSGKVVAALIDQDTRVRSAQVPFFGLNAATPSTLVALAKKFDCRIVTAFMVKKTANDFELLVDEIDREQSTEEILVEYNKILEGYIRRYPEQWVWFHKRWRTLESGVKLSSKEYASFLQEQHA